MGLDKKKTHCDFHKFLPSNPLLEAPACSTEYKHIPPATSFEFQEDDQPPISHSAIIEDDNYPQAPGLARYEDTSTSTSDLPPPCTRGTMESVAHRILIKKQIDDERSKRTRSYVTTLLLSLALGICFIGLMVVLTLYGMKTPPFPAMRMHAENMTLTSK